MTGSTRIALVDDHPLFREGVRRSLEEFSDLTVIGEGASRDDAIALAARNPDVLLLDISIPGGGLSALEAIMSRQPELTVVMLTVSEAGHDVARALRAGARGYVLKGIGTRELGDMIRQVARGQNYVSPSLSAQLLSEMHRPAAVDAMEAGRDLTTREREVLQLAAEGLSNKRIAIKLDLQEKTVKHHMSRVLAKLKVTNRTEAALRFLSGKGGEHTGTNTPAN